jgi:hypothetical protein
MINNDGNNSNQPKETNNNNENTILSNLANNGEKKNNVQNKEDEMDDSDNLKFKGFLPTNTDPFILQRLDSNSSPIAAQYKFSIDMPNVSKQRLHEYLNNDLLNALDSPSISKINSGIPENIQNLNDLGDNNPNNLYGFSLYPQTQANNREAGNDMNNNYNFQNPKMNNDNYNYQNNFNYNYPINNNVYYQNFNNNYTNLNYNINNPKIFIPTKLRNNEQNNKQNNNKKEPQNNGKNKFDNGKKNKQKNKKYFEVREGDWRCSQCNNLNFSFRNKCNRCNLPKELSQSFEPLNQQSFNQNQQFKFVNGMNPNIIQGNANNGSNFNVNVNYPA